MYRKGPPVNLIPCEVEPRRIYPEIEEPRSRGTRVALAMRVHLKTLDHFSLESFIGITYIASRHIRGVV